MSNDSGPSVYGEWIRVARKDWTRAQRNLKDRDIEAAGFSFNNPWRSTSSCQEKGNGKSKPEST